MVDVVMSIDDGVVVDVAVAAIGPHCNEKIFVCQRHGWGEDTFKILSNKYFSNLVSYRRYFQIFPNLGQRLQESHSFSSLLFPASLAGKCPVSR